MNSIWWSGPRWLTLDNSQWPQQKTKSLIELPETKASIINFVINNQINDTFPFSYTSSFTKLIRVTAWCLRFVHNSHSINNKFLDNLSTIELDNALKRLVHLSQIDEFSDLIQTLKNKSEYKGKFANLSPFLDKEGLIRVGGRLQNSNFNFNKKHPLLISSKHSLTKLIFEHEHKRLLHGGPQLLLSSIRDKFWPINGRNLAKRTVHKCLTCFRNKPSSQPQLMGNLPYHRVTTMYPFYAVGVDYAGPFLVKPQRGRGNKAYKCYICLYVCFSTKAVHLEPVTDLTTEAFLATFRRFISRRGKPSVVYSDNGKIFLGATSQLKELGQFLSKNHSALNDMVVNDGIQWNFIPANSPHFGGLWEAGVRSTKHHLRRVLNNTIVTFEDFLTILTQIEGILNSRPLHPLSK